MPYEIKKRDTKYCVVKTDTGETVKCHPTRKEAIDHLAALKINVEDASMELKKETGDQK